MRTFTGIIIFNILIISSVTFAVQLERRDRIQRHHFQDIVYLPPAWLIRTFSFGYYSLSADYFWIQALQYWGNTQHRRLHYRDLHRYIDLVTEMDPDFEFAYLFGGTVIPQNIGRWTWVNTEKAVDILERGVERFPDNWRMWMTLGATHTLFRDDYEAGAEAYRMAAEKPETPDWVKGFVSRLLATAGKIDHAKRHTEAVLASTDDPNIIKAMERRLLELEIEAVLQNIDSALEKYIEERGDLPLFIHELVDEGFIKYIPACPLGGSFELDPNSKRSYSTVLSHGRFHVIHSPDRIQETLE